MSTALNWRETIELLTDYLEGLLPCAGQGLLEAHLAACPECVEFLRAYREMPRILREVTAVQLPDELLSERRFFGEFLGTPEPPAERVPPAVEAVHAYRRRFLELARPRLDALAPMPEPW